MNQTPTDAPLLPAAPTLDAPAITARTGALLDQLERAARAARTRLTISAESDAVIGHVELGMRQQEHSYARQFAARELMLAEEALRNLDAALADARTALAEHEPALRSLAEAGAGRRARLEVLGDTEDPREKALVLAQLAHGRLRRLLEQVEPWRATAVDAVARLAQATVIALRRHRVEALSRELAALKARRDALRESDPHDTEACAVLERLAERVGRPLPVPRIRWPAKGGLFDPPELVEVE